MTRSCFRRLFSTLIAACFVFLVAAPSQGEVKVYVTNCIFESESDLFYAFNGKDSDCTIPYDSSWVYEQQSQGIKCKGQGKGRCKMTANRSGSKDCGDLGRVNVDDGETLIVFEASNKIETYATASSEKANCCGDHISDGLCDNRYDNCTLWDFNTEQCATYMVCMLNGGSGDDCKSQAE